MIEPARHEEEIPTIGPSGDLQRLSVSTLKKAKECLRRFYFSKVMRLPEPTWKAQVLGTEGHAQNEHYLKTGENVLSPVALAGLHLIPPPGPGLLSEMRFGPPATAWDIDGVPVTGFVDLVNLRKLPFGILRITDFKFIRSLSASWASKPDQLKTVDHEHGIQMIGYAVAASARWPEAEHFELEHINYQTQGANRAESVLTGVTRDYALEEWQRITPLVRSMKEAARAKDPRDVPPTFTSKCERCPFQGRCEEAELSLTTQHQTQSDEVLAMNLLDQLFLKSAPVVPPSTITPVAVMSLEAKVVQGSAARMGLEPVAVVVPPDAPKSDPKLAAETPAPAAPATEEKAKRARRTKAEMEAARAAESVASPAVPSPVAEVVPAPSIEAPAPTEKTGERLRLYVDCVPNEPAHPLSGYVAEMAQKVARESGALDLRFAPEGSAISFGKWKGKLALAVRGNPPEPRAYLAQVAGSELAQVVVETLEGMCGPGCFVRGVR